MSVFHLSGSASRREFFWALLPILALSWMIYALGQDPQAWRAIRFLEGGWLLAFGLLLMVSVRRLHDVAWSGAYALLLAVPGVNAILVLMLLLKRPAGRKRLGYSRYSPYLPLVVLVILALAGVRFFTLPIGFMSSEMKPTLMPGDYVWVGYGAADDIRRGDVVAFVHPALQRPAMGRVVGMGGDQVQLQGGRLWLNGRELQVQSRGHYEERMVPQGPDRVLPRCEGGAVGAGGICQKSLLIQSLPRETVLDPSQDRSFEAKDDLPRLYEFDILNIEDDSYGDKTEVFHVPQGSFFILGDNRDNSIDSRYAPSVGGIGFVASDQIIGRGGRVLVSVAGDHVWKVWTWRWDRMLEKVK